MLTGQMSVCKLFTLNGNHCLGYNDPSMTFYCIVKEVKKKKGTALTFTPKICDVF